MISGKTKLVGILGWPVEHSLSPQMHNTAFADSGLDYCYVPLPAAPEKLADAIKGLKATGFIGANVTIPHKVEVMQYLDEIDASAQLVGAVNTIAIKEGKAIGYNTDAEGFIASLKTKNVVIEGKKAVLLGAGGAARAVVCGLLNHGIEHITIGARNTAKVTGFVAQCPNAEKISGFNWNDNTFVNALKECDILINSTPMGMANHTNDSQPIDFSNLPAHTVVCDLIYNPPVTPFLERAQEHKHQIINGEGMLVEQGALAFEIWTGCRPFCRNMYNIFLK